MTVGPQEPRPRAAVLGGGPAGCAAAITLARAGIEVILLEQGGPNRDKACGDALIPSAADAIADLLGTPLSVATLAARSFDEIEFAKGDHVIWRVSFGGRWGYTARRAELDQALRDAAARLVEVHHRTRALAIDSRADGHVVSAVRSDGRPMDIRVDAVCIATGGTGTFSRDLGIDGEPLAAVSVSAYVGGPGSDAPRFELHDSCRPGYRWSFPMADGRRNVGLCLLGGSAAGIRAVADSFVAETPGLATPRWRGGREPLWSGRGRRWHAPNGIVSCGDAAGLVDPANGEGITAAVESGARAGESIAAYLTGGRRDIPLQQYSDWVRGSFEDRYASTPVRAVWRSMAGIGG